MNKRIVIGVVSVLALIGVLVYFLQSDRGSDVLVLQGNVDLRQIELPFADSERIAAVLVEEGTQVKAGQVLARLDTARLIPKMHQAQARIASQSEALRRLTNGARTEEVAQARAAVAAAEAEAANAKSQFDRLRGISDASSGRAVSQQDLDAASAALRMGDARLENSRKSLQLTLAGPRVEDIAQAQAQLEGAQAELALLDRQLQDAELRAPVDAIVRSRLMEPGELATPQRPVFSLAVSSPKWVRAYVPEANLSRLELGDAAHITSDSHPDAPLNGTLRFISSVAEFTPKTVQTEELRTSLVYEVRILVDDPEDKMRLGMPATVRFDKSSNTSAAAPTHTASAETAP
jgi:HlyD family secretion protein